MTAPDCYLQLSLIPRLAVTATSARPLTTMLIAPTPAVVLRVVEVAAVAVSSIVTAQPERSTAYYPSPNLE